MQKKRTKSSMPNTHSRWSHCKAYGLAGVTESCPLDCCSTVPSQLMLLLGGSGCRFHRVSSNLSAAQLGRLATSGCVHPELLLSKLYWSLLSIMINPSWLTVYCDEPHGGMIIRSYQSESQLRNKNAATCMQQPRCIAVSTTTSSCLSGPLFMLTLKWRSSTP